LAAKRETEGMEKESRDQDETLRPVNKIAGLARVAEDRGVRGGGPPATRPDALRRRNPAVKRVDVGRTEGR